MSKPKAQVKTLTSNKKTIQNIAVEIAGTQATFGDLIKMVVNSVPVGGLTIEDIKTRVAILSKAEGLLIEFSKEEAETVKAMTKEMRWAVVSEGILQFAEAIENL